MKVITEDAVFVQMNDIVFLNSTDLPIPASIVMEVFGKGITIVNDSNRYDFVKFEESTQIDFFKDLDWIVDYCALKDKSEEQIKKEIDQVIEERNKIADKFNNLPEYEKNDNFDLVSRYEQLEYKAYSMRDLLWFKQGHIDMELPEEATYPSGYKPTIKTRLKRLIKSKKQK